MSTLQIYGSYAMTSEEQELPEQYLTHLNVLGDEGTHPDFDAWYQEVRYAQGPNAPQSLEEASELRYKDVLDAARVFTTCGKHRTLHRSYNPTPPAAPGQHPGRVSPAPTGDPHLRAVGNVERPG